MIAPQFCLDTKEPKSQDKKNLQPAGPAPGPVFCRAFARVGLLSLTLQYVKERWVRFHKRMVWLRKILGVCDDPLKYATNLRRVNWISADTVLSVLAGEYSPGLSFARPYPLSLCDKEGN